MTTPAAITFARTDLDAALAFEGVVAVAVPGDGAFGDAARRVDEAAGGALARAAASPAWRKVKEGGALELAFPAGLGASAVAMVRLPDGADRDAALQAGAALARMRGSRPLLVLGRGDAALADLALGAALRGYAFTDHKSRRDDEEGEDAAEGAAAVTVMCDDPEALERGFADARAVAEGVFLTRDLVNEPANVLSTVEFVRRLEGLRDLGLEVEVLDEAKLEELGMRTLLGVGRGSETPTFVVVMQWRGGGDEKPLALVGKGVVFDTGGISLKPAAGMEDMTMDMGGAGTVAGVMHALARRGAKANVVGLVGLVENMPDGRAQRPGDVVRSMKGDTVEVINTDAEGRLVLADVMWYAQERFEPRGMIDLATLTGAIVVGLGHENAGVFSNDDRFCDAFLAAAKAEGEDAWRMPLGKAYDKLLKSRVADMKNVGGRAAGSITAAQFLQRFVRDGTPWIHLDIAGVASTSKATDLAPAGATGWGVRALDRMVREGYEDGAAG